MNSIEFGVQEFDADLNDWVLRAVPRDFSLADRIDITGDPDADDRTLCEKLAEAWRENCPGRKYRVCIREVAPWCEMAGGAQ